MTRSRTLQVWLIAGYVFLYGPIALLIATSFNAGRSVTVWSGFSFRWYVQLWNDPALISAALLSLRVAAIAATVATIMGTLAGYALTRLGRFRGRVVFASLVASRLVLPDVLIGLSLLLLFVASQQAVGWPSERGAVTIAIAHATFALAYVAVVVEARLADLSEDLEQAAMDLGASPAKTFLLITVPLLGPALLSGWLLAFTLSLDDLVVASFVSGPGATTLPMVLFSSLKLGATPVLNAVATILLGTISLILFTGLALRRPRRGGAGEA